jgi:hypothetical protein
MDRLAPGEVRGRLVEPAEPELGIAAVQVKILRRLPARGKFLKGPVGLVKGLLPGAPLEELANFGLPG